MNFYLIIFLEIFKFTNEILIQLNLKNYSSTINNLYLLNNSESLNSFNPENLLDNNSNHMIERVNQLNNKNFQYFTTIYVGSLNQSMNVLIDTQSNFLLLSSKNILERNRGKKHNLYMSSSLNNLNIFQSIQYSVAKVDGLIVSDRISFGSNISLQDQNFLLVTRATGLNNFLADGVLGLNINNEINSKYSMIRQLYDNKIISSPSFGLYLSKISSQSRLIIGHIWDSRQFNHLIDKMQSCLVDIGSDIWQCSMQTVSINNKNLTINSNVIFDSGASFIVIPLNDFKVIKNETIGNNTCAINTINQLVCQCESSLMFSDIILNFKNNTITLNHDDLISYQPNYKYACRFNIIIDLNNVGSWVLGVTALRGLLIYYEINNRKISFIKTDLLSEILEIDASKELFSLWIIFWISLVFLIIVLSLNLYCCCITRDDFSDETINNIE